MITVNTTRFGSIEVNPDTVITFEQGVFGFEELTAFTIVDPKDDNHIYWLQSMTNSAVAFPILRSVIFTRRLEIEGLHKHEISYYILTIPNDITKMTANFKAPIFVDTVLKKGRQVLLKDRSLNVLEPIYLRLRDIITKTTKWRGPY